jgi:hypothetical protein
MSPSLAHGTSSHYPKGLTNLTPFGRSLCWSANSLLELVGVFMPQMQDKYIKVHRDREDYQAIEEIILSIPDSLILKFDQSMGLVEVNR